MILLIILGSGARAAAAATTGPAAPGLAKLAGQLRFPLGMIYVSIPRVKYIFSTFIGVLVLRYRKYQGCDILLSVILVTCT